jgi:methyltransferase (TIGR00027 family)
VLRSPGMRSGQPSETARRVAAQRITFERRPAEYGDPEADDRLARHVAGDLLGSSSPLRAYLEARTRFFDTVVVAAIEGGIDQVVIAAAGYDGRAWRYARPGVGWFEVDHPITQKDKVARLDELGIVRDHVRFIGADFALDPLAPALLAAGLDAERPCVFLLEGVAVYLERATLETVLRDFGRLAAPGSLLAISISVSSGDPDLSSRRQAFQAAVASMGEPTRSTLSADEVDPLLLATGWRRRDSDDAPGARAGLIVARSTRPRVPPG